MTLEEWAARLRRESTCSVVDHSPRECGELAALLAGVLEERDRLRRVFGESVEAPSIAAAVAGYLERSRARGDL